MGKVLKGGKFVDNNQVAAATLLADQVTRQALNFPGEEGEVLSRLLSLCYSDDNG